jgi:hypothetical protein
VAPVKNEIEEIPLKAKEHFDFEKLIEEEMRKTNHPPVQINENDQKPKK